ncbi:MAG: hypothetical protein ACRESS_06180 [Stenotrophobium sp.]
MAKKTTGIQKPSMDTGKAALKAGLHLLTQGVRASSLSTGMVAADAGITSDAFKRAYPEFIDYLLDLLQRLMDDVAEETLRAREHLPRGDKRLRLGIISHLDAMLQRPELLELSHALRNHPRCKEIARKRLQILLKDVGAELKLSGVGNASGFAPLAAAMLTETARAEHDAHRPLKDFRATLISYFSGFLATS